MSATSGGVRRSSGVDRKGGGGRRCRFAQLISSPPGSGSTGDKIKRCIMGKARRNAGGSHMRLIPEHFERRVEGLGVSEATPASR